MSPVKNEEEIENKGNILIGDDLRRIKKKVTDAEEDIKNAFKIFRGIVVENGKTSHDYIMELGDYLLFKMRHKIPERKNKRSGYRIYYLTNKGYDFFLPAFVYIRDENFGKSEAIRIIQSRLS